jgi:hypothetical protein
MSTAAAAEPHAEPPHAEPHGEPHAEPQPPGDAPAQPTLAQALQAVLQELPGVVSDRVKLAALEVRRAGIALAQVVALAVASAILLITAWLAVWVGLAYAAIQYGMPWGWTLLLVLVINVGAAALALLRARALLALLGLPATVRRLTVRQPAPEPAAPPAPIHEPPRQPLAS